MRLGAMLHPQGFGGLLFKGRTCAMGAAYAAVGLRERMGVAHMLLMLNGSPWWQFLNEPAPVCPECEVGSGTIMYGLILHLNDGHRWTRERIADYIETIEPQQEREEYERGIPAGTTV